jgi:hypothetical protein
MNNVQKAGIFHQRTHFFLGFIFESIGHLNALENSIELEILPITLILGGLCKSDKIDDRSASGVDFVHQF